MGVKRLARVQSTIRSRMTSYSCTSSYMYLKYMHDRSSPMDALAIFPFGLLDAHSSLRLVTV
jgi:hypothetical protein